MRTLAKASYDRGISHGTKKAIDLLRAALVGSAGIVARQAYLDVHARSNSRIVYRARRVTSSLSVKRGRAGAILSPLNCASSGYARSNRFWR